MNEHCIVCGADIPEGRQVCPNCEQKPQLTKNPCFGCVPPKRTPTCHITCPEYAEFCVFLENKRQERMADQIINNYLADKNKYMNRWKR